LRAVKFALQAIAVTSFIGTVAPAVAGQQIGTAGDAGSLDSILAGSDERAQSIGIQLAFHEGEMTGTLPVGTIRLRVIDRVGGRTLKAPITWRLLTYGRDEEGQRHLFAEVKSATPELILPAAWYIVYAHLPNQVIQHPVEVTAGRTFKYTLVKKSAPGGRTKVVATGTNY
jgi:hypothetical protein